MKRSFWFGLLLFLLLVGCAGQSGGEPSHQAAPAAQEPTRDSNAEKTEGDFVYRLVSEKAQYASGEQIELYAELEYTGEQDEITISHAASPFWFPMKELTRDYQISYGMNEPLLHTTIKRGEPLREYYKGAYGYSSEDAKEYKQFIQSLENGFPEGRYVVYGTADFFVSASTGLDSSEEPEVYKLKAEIEFNVK